MHAGGAAIKKYAVLNNKRHIITKDTESNVAIYDVLKVIKKENLGKVDFDEQLKKLNQRVYIPNWFTVDLKIGVSTHNTINCTYNLYHLRFSDANYCARARRSGLLCRLGVRRGWNARPCRQ